MNKPILVDTSVWIEFFKGTDSNQVKILTNYIENDLPIFLCPTVIQEILQGIKKDKQYKEIKSYLLAFNILNDDSLEMVLSAVDLYRSLRKKGVTIRKSNDCLIAQYAINHALTIIHQDRDFDLILANYNKS